MSFHCTDPYLMKPFQLTGKLRADFHVRSVPDEETFSVSRQALCTSEIFRDMFSCCAESDETLDLYESSDSLAALLTLLHYPPIAPIQSKRDESSLIPRVSNDPKTVIPLPLLPLLFTLVDKYALPDSTMEILGEHLLAHAPEQPLRVYTFAASHGSLHSVVSQSSQYLRPMADYSTDEVKMMPTVEAYHRVVQLQDVRVKSMRKLLLSEAIFPHGYGSCPSHSRETTELWHSKRTSLAAKVETLTDVAGEMEIIVYKEPVQSCALCRKACIAAVEMLRVIQMPKSSKDGG